jgi:hypothetical protein
MPDWNEIKWYKADTDYNFALSKALIFKPWKIFISNKVFKGEYYIPLGLFYSLPFPEE